MSESPVQQQLLSIQTTLLGIQTTLVRQEGVHAQLKSSLDRLEDLFEDHESRLRTLEAARNRSVGVSRVGVGAITAAVSIVSGVVLFLLQKLLGG